MILYSLNFIYDHINFSTSKHHFLSMDLFSWFYIMLRLMIIIIIIITIIIINTIINNDCNNYFNIVYDHNPG